MITCVQKDTHKEKLTVRTELASSSQECQIEQVCKMCGLEFKMLILSSEKTGPNFFPKISSCPEISSSVRKVPTYQIVSLLFCGALCFEGK